jgi:group I intron endonuclease
MEGVIYCATSPSNKKYNGFTFDFESRKNRHINESEKHVDETHFHRAIRHYGKNYFSWSIKELHHKETKEELIKLLYERETYWINEDKTYLREYGYNLTLGGTGGDTFSFKSEMDKNITREKMRISQLNQSQETRNKRSKSSTGLIRSKEACENISKGRKGIVFTEKHKQNISKKTIEGMSKIEIYNSKKVNSYTIDKVFLCQYKSMWEAVRETKLTLTKIKQSCERKISSYKAYRLTTHIFRYDNDDEFKIIKI